MYSNETECHHSSSSSTHCITHLTTYSLLDDHRILSLNVLKWKYKSPIVVPSAIK